MTMSVLPERPRRGSQRLRRVTWTISILGVLLAILAVVTWRVRKENQLDE
jgi:predicted negative regulator of RcsB-dependent stress response